jgi:hypothetical protein
MAQTTQQYFDAFFDEKDIDPDETFEFEDSEGTWHHMTYGVVIEAVKGTRAVEATNIAATLRRLDFANGDVRDFLRHLGRAMAQQRITNS